jgi:hypothetical protein
MRHRRSDTRARRYELIVCIALAATLGLGLLLATKRDLPALMLARASPEHAVAATIEARTASIVLEPQGGRCRDLIFNNDTGEIAETAKPCVVSVAADDKGVPLPVGTVRRLDAISKSFLKK